MGKKKGNLQLGFIEMIVSATTEQIEKLKSDPNFQEISISEAFPVFQANKTQLKKIEKLLKKE